MLNILVTGAQGQVGSELYHLADQYPHHFFFTKRSDLDITDFEKVEQYIAG